MVGDRLDSTVYVSPPRLQQTVNDCLDYTQYGKNFSIHIESECQIDKRNLIAKSITK